jgi:hypothetical protein
MAAADESLGILVDHAQVCLNELINGSPDAQGVNGRHPSVRLAALRVLHTLPVTTKALYARAKLSEAFEYVLFYERTRRGMTGKHFLDGVPAGVQLFSGETTIKLPDSQVGRLKMADMAADRLQTVSKLEGMAYNEPRKLELIAKHSAGLSNQVPGAVRVFIARTRAMSQRLRRVKKNKHFVQCENCNCNRLFYVGEPGEVAQHPIKEEPGPSNSGEDVYEADEDEEEATSEWYWRAAGRRDKDRPYEESRARRFCSLACDREHALHVRSIMPETEECMDADDHVQTSKKGRARVAEAFKKALARNGVAARELRMVKWKARRNLAVSRAEVNRLVEKKVWALNIDIAVLYASSLLAESQALSRGKTLPGAYECWRCDPMVCSKALRNVRDLYKRSGHGTVVVSSLLTMPRFMENVRARVAHLL